MTSDSIDPVVSHEQSQRRERRKLFAVLGLIFLLLVIWLLTAAFYDCSPPPIQGVLVEFTESEDHSLAELQDWLDEHHFVIPRGEYSIPNYIRKLGDAKAFTTFLPDNREQLQKLDVLLQSNPASWRWKPFSIYSASTRHGQPYLLENLAQLVHLQGRKQLADQQFSEALETALKLLRFGHGLQLAQGNLGQFSVGCSIQFKGYQLFHTALQHLSLNAEALAKQRNEVAALEPNYGDFHLAFSKTCLDLRDADESVIHDAMIYFYHSSSFEKAVENYEYKRYRTLSQALAYRNQLSAALYRGWPGVEKLKDQSEMALHEKLLALLSGNRAGHFISRSSYQLAIREVEQLFQCQALNRLTQMALQIRIFELRHGHIPSTKEELQADASAPLPLDPFGRSPQVSLQWNPTSRLLYSVGLDGIDDGGNVNSQEPEQGLNIGFHYRSVLHASAPPTSK